VQQWRCSALRNQLGARKLPSMTKPNLDTGDSAELARCARDALERVCSGADRDPPSRYYSPEFRDHVNNLEFRGLEDVRRSVDIYKSALSDLSISVEEQLVDGDRVTSRFVVEGTHRGRRVRFNGITVSRFENNLIVEDWSVTDTLGMLRQLGVWRSISLGVSQWRALSKTKP
jgi:predicted ester cyclase